MKVSTKWLSDYITLEIAPQELAEKIERTAVEVDEVTRMSTGLKKIVVGFTKEVTQHPESDHLHLCQVDVGEAEPLQIICGAPNITAGKKVIVALPNSRIAGNVKIKRGKLRGELSEGMICSLQEIGFAEGVVPKEFAEGIYFLPDDAHVGEPVFDYLGMNEDVIDLDVTPNRADMLSMRGTAYELAAIYNKKLTLHHPAPMTENPAEVSAYIKPTAAPELASTYLMRVIKDVTVKPSPQWLQTRLWNAGIRPTNNLVDVTNYILLDYGQPLHAFDQDKLVGKNIQVRLAKPGEKLITLDEQERELRTTDIVIADEAGPVALAGTMGGLRTAVGPNTTTVVLESAVFDSSAIRKTARRHNLHSEASMRFERGINRATVAEALDAAAQLIAQLGDGTVVGGRAVATKEEVNSVSVAISLKKINDVLGTKLSMETVKDIFTRLDFTVSVSAAGQFEVQIPPHRWDISIPADLIEEVARIYGYDNLPATLPKGELTPGHYTYKQSVLRAARRLLEEAGLTQAISYGLTTHEKAAQFMMEASEETKLAFPMSSDRTTVRMNLISGLLDDIAYNTARKVNNVALYEQGRVFYRSAGNVRPREVEHLAGAMTGLFRNDTWYGAKQPVDFYLLKGIVEHLLNSLGVKDVQFKTATGHEEMHPGRTADIYAADKFLGFLGEVHPNICKEYALKATYVFELDLQQIIELPKKQAVYTPVSRYPEITRDVALAVDQEVENAAIVDFINAKSGKYLVNVELFDVYEGAHIAPGKKSLAYKLTYQDENTTLSDEVVTADFEKVMTKVKSEFNAEIR
ncbi:phenylalanine--tRNA ligase subunit beta [Liquorilactobacillus satsumensis]|uniref:Phenylalanine--tRNA ligase beta subunit n=1 Tax=Liquorilactobacillus satsumensis DSM 16230 = JCM 12392 TaxID=1423801 RepID=A0A0R1UXM6_9LACO|nr:phenylalanine--tRNA ligase subunit beta [Liquorilactobacillus satsumensis]KRL98025.1 phenylalanyl-tRNA synthetase subunit beta [Liquorilactobacillus satsumensis DSM 16230 = JCM 12392]